MMQLHHINIVSYDVQGLDAFYRTALGLERMDPLPIKAIQGYNDGSPTAPRTPARFLAAGDDPEQLQLHLCAPDQSLGVRHGHTFNPVSTGHIAYRTDDIEAAKRRLEDAGIPYSDYGEWAVKDWHQIFFLDPVGNVIEIHQVMR